MAAVLLALGSSLSFGIADFFGGLARAGRRRRRPARVADRRARGDRARRRSSAGDGPPDAVFVPLALAASVLGVVGLAALYRGLATGMMSVVAPIAATASCVAVVAGRVTGRDGRRRSRTRASRSRSAASILVSLAAKREAKRARGLAAGAGLGLVAAAASALFLIAFDRAADGRPLLGDARAPHRLVSLLAPLPSPSCRPSIAVRARRGDALLLLGRSASSTWPATPSSRSRAPRASSASSRCSRRSTRSGRSRSRASSSGNGCRRARPPASLCAFAGVALIAAG